MDELDCKLIKELSRDSRITYAELGRKYNLSRVCIRERINSLVNDGVIKKFTIEVNPEKLGKKLSVFLNIDVKPDALYKIAEELAEDESITSIYLLTGSTTIYMNVLLKDQEELETFLKEKLYSRGDIFNVTSRLLLREFTGSNGGLGDGPT